LKSILVGDGGWRWKIAELKNNYPMENSSSFDYLKSRGLI